MSVRKRTVHGMQPYYMLSSLLASAHISFATPSRNIHGWGVGVLINELDHDRDYVLTV